MESMIQFQSDPFDMIEARLRRLENMLKNEEILPTQSFTIPDTSSHIDKNQFRSDPFDMIEERLSRLENMRRNEETLPSQFWIIPNTSSHIDEKSRIIVS